MISTDMGCTVPNPESSVAASDHLPEDANVSARVDEAALVVHETVQVAAGTREAIHQDFIKFARAKGLKPRRVIGVHLMKVIMIPVVTVLGLELGNLVAFSVV
ncbi:MAG: ABC transporter permease subunit, partial [Akkermansiaceae bacterium]|nr:ABC transporter permease subunit [Akkermansiaceae bacterium]